MWICGRRAFLADRKVNIKALRQEVFDIYNIKQKASTSVVFGNGAN